MRWSIESYLEHRLAEGGFVIGQVRVHPGCVLHHILDSAEDAELRCLAGPQEARSLVLYDAENKYRPLKTAPNLRKGWKLVVPTTHDLRLALDIIYPATVGIWVAWKNEEIDPVPWRDTVGRQTGMYRITGKITDEQSETLISSACNHETGCMREILWPISPGKNHSLGGFCKTQMLREREASGEIPLLCIEACNLLVAAARPVVKDSLPQPSAPPPAAG